MALARLPGLTFDLSYLLRIQPSMLEEGLRSGPVRHIVIVGGGTSGWMSAAALARMAGHSGVAVTLIESGQRDTEGAVEATVPSVRMFHDQLELDENDLVRRTQGTFKLGTEFVDWRARGSRYLHPFSSPGANLEGIGFHQFWLKLRHLGDTGAGDLADHNLCSVAARMNRFARPERGEEAVPAALRYALHLDAGAYADYLRNHAEARGVRRMEGRIAEVRVRPGDGFIRELLLEDGRTVQGDLYLDCSGLRGVLIARALHVGFRDWRHWLPCDRVITAPCKRIAPLLPYTRATADAAGWRWRIPLQHRTENGHVYCSDLVPDVVAQARLLCQLDGPANAPVRLLKFAAGHRWRFWEKNCVAIGPAGGFLEPLESTGIHLIQVGLARLLACFPDRSFAGELSHSYNRYMTEQYRRVRDFIILHYKVTERRDTPFWQHCREMRVPASLQEKIDLFRANATVWAESGDLFTAHSWIAVLLGQGIRPVSYGPLVDSLPVETVRQFVRHVGDWTRQTALAMPEHDAFIDRHCSAGRPPAPCGVSDSYT